MPLAVLAWAAPGHGTALFRRVRARDVGWNLWVSTGAHVLNDWSLFALAL